MSQRDPRVWEEKQKQMGESCGIGSFHLQEADTVSIMLINSKGYKSN